MAQNQKVSVADPIKVIIGLGNPGPTYYNHRHNIGFKIVDALAQKYFGTWQTKNNAQICQISINDKNITLIKPLTFMNSSGDVVPALLKKGITPSAILVIHDELEKPFGTLAFKLDGSHRGHNGLRSIINTCGAQFARLRFGIGRPHNKEDVADYVLQPFSEDKVAVEQAITQAVDMIEKLFI